MSIQAVLGLVTTSLPILIPLGQFLYQLLLEKLPSNQRGVLEEIAGTVVGAVEQIGQSQFLTPEEKKAKASSSIVEIATQLGVGKYASPAVVDALIESLVLELNASQGQSAQGVSLPPAGVIQN